MKLTSKDINWEDGMKWAYVRRNHDAVFEQVEAIAATPFTNFYIVERTPKKTVVDAVNYYHGGFICDWNANEYNKPSINICIKSNKDYGQEYNKGEMYVGGTDCDDKYFTTVCTKEEFNQCVKEMSFNYRSEPYPSEDFACWEFSTKEPLTKENSDYSYYETMLHNEKGETIGDMINSYYECVAPWTPSGDEWSCEIHSLEINGVECKIEDNQPSENKFYTLNSAQDRIYWLNDEIKLLHETIELKEEAIELLKSASKPKKEKRWVIYDNKGEFCGSVRARPYKEDGNNHQVFEIEIDV